MESNPERRSADEADPVPDTLLCAIATDRDRSAYQQLFARFAPRIKSYLMRTGSEPSQAEELAQETMLTVWHRAETFDPKLAAATTWIFTIARNKRIDAARRTRPFAFDPEDPAFVTAPSPSGEVLYSRQQSGNRLLTAISTLPPEQADLVRRAFYDDMAHTAIADATGLPLGTVKSRLRMAMQRLKRVLTDDDRPEEA
jgi:RNA polymerase sigma-70 factor (ECF subfamily)